MSTRPGPLPDSPQIGDVVVSPDPQTPGHFTIRQIPVSPSIRWDSRHKAEDVARGFARARGVGVWFQAAGAASPQRLDVRVK